MEHRITRRQFFSGTLGATAVAALCPRNIFAGPVSGRNAGTSLKYSLNAYSFHGPLSKGEMTLFDLVDFCASVNFNGLDATGYYFPGHPEVPTDEYIYKLKQKAFLNGITINGTGVRNDFALPDPESRKKDIQRIKNWIEVASKLGASVIRVFPGTDVPEGYTCDQVLEWMVPNIKECAEYGEKYGVIVGVQNHNNFLKTADQTIKLLDAIDSEWVGVILDTGSLRTLDPYEEIEKLLPYAVSWQIKEMAWIDGKAIPIDLSKINEIINRVGYRGFIPIETLGAGDPKVKVEHFLSQVRETIKG